MFHVPYVVEIVSIWMMYVIGTCYFFVSCVAIVNDKQTKLEYHLKNLLEKFTLSVSHQLQFNGTRLLQHIMPWSANMLVSYAMSVGFAFKHFQDETSFLDIVYSLPTNESKRYMSMFTTARNSMLNYQIYKSWADRVGFAEFFTGSVGAAIPLLIKSPKDWANVTHQVNDSTFFAGKNTILLSKLNYDTPKNYSARNHRQIAIRIPTFHDENNIFHLLICGGALFMAIDVAQKYSSSDEIIVFLETYKKNQYTSAENWFISAFSRFGLNVYVSDTKEQILDTLYFDEIILIHCLNKDFGPVIPGVIYNFQQFEVNRGPLTMLTNLHSRHVRKNTITDTVVIFLRNPRFLVDYATGSALAIIEEIQKLGLPINVITGTTNSEVQIDTCERAAVLISVHGAELSNMIFMKPG